ncbi:hypothetical protein FOFC_14057, partial [Fusarium oxysporum]
TRRLGSASALLYETQGSWENLISSRSSGTGDFEMGGMCLKRAKVCCNTYCSLMPLVTCVHHYLELLAG